MQPGWGQILGAVRGSGSDWDSGLGLGYRAALCPDSTKRSLLNGLIPLRAHLLQGPGCGFGNGDEPGLLSRSVEIGGAGQMKTKVQFELLENCFFLWNVFFFNGMK